MNKYELAVVVSAKIEDEDRAATIEKVKEYITRFGGTVTEVDEWGKRKLAYEINYEGEGYYVLYNFESKPDFPMELERVINITDGVLRSIVVLAQGQQQ